MLHLNLVQYEVELEYRRMPSMLLYESLICSQAPFYRAFIFLHNKKLKILTVPPYLVHGGNADLMHGVSFLCPG